METSDKRVRDRISLPSVIFLGTVFLAGPAAAGDIYLSLGAGINFLSDIQTVGGLNGAEDRVNDQTFLSGPAVLGAAGYRRSFDNFGSLRAEVEAGYRDNDIDDLDFNGISRDVSGTASATSVMVNFLYEASQFSDIITPYLGGGIGAASIRQDVRYGPSANIQDDDTVFAYQLIGGVSYKLNDTVELFAEGRYFATADPQLTRNGGGPGGFARTEQDTEYSAANALLGIRVNF